MTGTIGIFGLGLVGMALAERLIGAGRSVMGYDIDAARMALLEQHGGAPVAPDAVWENALVFSAVFDTDQLAELIETAPEGRDGTLVTVSTCDPVRVEALGPIAAAKGWRLVEAPISGTSRQLADRDAVFLLSGTKEDADLVLPLLSEIGRAAFHVGPFGTGNRAKLAINLVLGLNRAALAEGLVFAERMGLETRAFLDLLQQSAAASAVMATKGPKMVARDFEPQGRIAQSAKDFGLILQAAEEQGLPLAETYITMMQDCVDHGEIDLDNSAVIRAVERARKRG